MPPNLQFTNAAQKSLLAAIELAKEAAHVHVTPIHLAVALLEESGGLLQSVLAKAGADVTPLQRALNKQLIRLPAQDPAPPEADLGPALHKVLRDAQTLMKNKVRAPISLRIRLTCSQNDSYISQDHFIVALLDDSSIQTALKEAELTAKSIKDAVTSLRAGKRVDSTDAEQGFEALRKYCLDLTSMANEGRLDPVISRESEIRRCITILCRRQKSNVVLIGEAGVGKTSVVEGLAQRIVARDVPPSLQGKLYSLDVGSLMAGASHRGDVEERVKSVLNEIEQAGKDGQPIILFIVRRFCSNHLELL